jgi:hypothetical protein
MLLVVTSDTRSFSWLQVIRARATFLSALLAGSQEPILLRGELYPEVVDACEGEGGVPSRLMKTDAGDGRQEGTPCRMFAGSLSGRTTRLGLRWMISRGRALVG